MMKVGAFAFALALVAAAGLAQTPGDVPMDLADIFAAAAVEAPGAAPPEGAVFAARPPEKIICSAIASCYPYSNVSCASNTNGDTCQAVDRNCSAGQRGYVRCGSSYTYCPVCPCTEGAIRYLFTGYCCSDGSNTKEKEQQQCINGQWVYTGVITCSGPCGPWVP